MAPTIRTVDLAAAPDQAHRDLLANGLRWYLRRTLGSPNVEQELQATLDLVAAATGSQQFESQAALISFARNAAQQVASRSELSKPLSSAAPAHRVQQMKKALLELAVPERDALLRYVEGQDPQHYCADLGISQEQFATLLRRFKERVAQLDHPSATQRGVERIASLLHHPRLA